MVSIFNFAMHVIRKNKKYNNYKSTKNLTL